MMILYINPLFALVKSFQNYTVQTQYLNGYYFLEELATTFLLT